MPCIGYGRCAMKLINKQNFFPTVCVIFTLLVLGKILLEAVIGGIFTDYQKNLLVMFGLSLIATFILSQHYRFGELPLLVVILGQYAILIGAVMLITWLSSFFEPLHTNGYRDMFLSFTIPYVIGAAVYYVSLFCETRRINKELEKIRRCQNDRYKENNN